MKDQDPIVTVSWLDEALIVLALRLRHEVALHRALRGSAGQEGFAGLLLNGAEAEAMLVDIAGLLEVSGTAAPLGQILQAETALAQRRMQPGSVWLALRDGFGLSDVALDLLVLAAAPAIDPRFGRVFGFLNDDMARRYLTPAVAHRLLDRHGLDLSAFRELLAPDAPLVAQALLHVGPERPLTEAPLRLDESMVDMLLRGRASFDAPLSGLWIAPQDQDPTPCKAARSLGKPLVAITAQRVLCQPDPLRHIRITARDAILNGALPCLTGADQLPTEVQRHLALFPPAALVVQSGDPAGWLHFGGGGTVLTDPDGSADAADDLARDRAFAGLAVRVRPGLTLDDLVLPPRTAAAMRRLRDAARTYDHVLDDWEFGKTFGKVPGLCALFKGPSGTGKTTAAAALAAALGLPLYRVNLAGLISKYIGETEKHLDRLFDAADRAGCALVFEEADALFGKRSEVNDAHDRYANQGTAFLLQRLETHRGLCLMTTNLLDNIDTAFLRRIDAVIDFPAPGLTERKRLWKRITLTRARLDAVDFDWLATHDLTGGEIRNACLTAAYRAAAAEADITTAGLAKAIAEALAKKGKPVMKSAFGDHFAASKDDF